MTEKIRVLISCFINTLTTKKKISGEERMKITDLIHRNVKSKITCLKILYKFNQQYISNKITNKRLINVIIFFKKFTNSNLESTSHHLHPTSPVLATLDQFPGLEA